MIPDIIENRNFPALNWLLDYFFDIPELYLIQILTLLLTIERTEKSNTDVENTNEKNEVLNNTQIDRILQRPFDQKEMLRSLRFVNFQFIKKLLEYVSNRLEVSWNNFALEDDEDQFRSEVSQLIKWTSTILDAHYPQFVFHNETSSIDTLLQLIESELKFMTEIESLEPLLSLTMTKTTFEPGPSPNSKYRSETVLFE